MIVKVEQIFDSLFDTIPVYDGNNKLFFGYGEQKELNSILINKQKNGEPCYPLLWYNLPNTLQVNRQYATGVFDFVLAHNTEIDLYNDQRFNTIFNNILYPHFSLVLQALQKANGIDLLKYSGVMEYEYTNYPNYGNPTTFEGKKEQKQVDIWDAINFKVRLNVHSKICDFSEIQYNLTNL